MLNNQLLLQGATGYNLTRSLRFRSSASAYLSRTPASAGNRKTWTYSTWIKRGALNADQSIFSSYFASNNNSTFHLSFFNDNTLRVGLYSGYALVTTQVFRDPSASYHIVLSVDTTQATADNRIKMYVNGQQITSFSTNTLSTNVSQNMDLAINSTNAHYQGYLNSLGWYLDGYLTETIMVDGQALTPSSFGQTSATTGVWQPKKYSGTYGTNGFYLPFTDNSALTSGSNAGLGKDFSGNGNYWNTNNISITAGATYDSMTDVPTLTSATASNFCTLNPILQNGWWAAPSRGNIINGNLTLSQNNGTAFSTFDVSTSGKWYLEGTVTTYGQSSAQSEFIVSAKSRSTFEISYLANGQKTINSTNSSYGSSWTTGDVIGIAIDPANNQVTFYKNGVSQGAITNTFPSETVLVGYYAEATGTDTINFNFGQRPFAYTPPTGYVALNTYNLPTPTIGATASSQANKYMDATLYTGNGTSQSIVNSGGFQPDMVWTKSRSNAYNNVVNDVLRGSTHLLITNGTDADQTDAQSITSFNSNGYSIGTAGTWNQNGSTFVGWQWKANGSGTTNTAGSITSTVSANTTSGFSVVTYTGNGSAGATVGHGLGVAPKMIIVKARSFSDDWLTYHASLGNTQFLKLNSTIAAATSTVWNNTSPTSSVFSLGTSTGVNQNTSTFVAYCFAEVAGYSKFGSYTGNGSSDGPFVYTGFRPKFFMWKRTDVASNPGWTIIDSSRNTYNYVDNELVPNSSAAESAGGATYNEDFLSNGVKFRNTGAGANASGGTYIYAAFAENPFKYSLAR